MGEDPGFSMNQLLVNIDVPELDAGIRFYTEALGLTVGRRMGPGFAELLGAGVPIYLLAQAPGTAPYPDAVVSRDYGRHWTPVHLDLAVPDLDAAVCRAERAGAVRQGDLVERPWGKMLIFADPFGHGFCLLEFNERGYDAITTA